MSLGLPWLTPGYILHIGTDLITGRRHSGEQTGGRSAFGGRFPGQSEYSVSALFWGRFVRLESAAVDPTQGAFFDAVIALIFVGYLSVSFYFVEQVCNTLGSAGEVFIPHQVKIIILIFTHVIRQYTPQPHFNLLF